MSLFGFAGAIRANGSAAEAEIDATRSTGGLASFAPAGADDFPGRAWSSEGIVAGPIAVAIKGTPLWRDNTTAPASLQSIVDAYRSQGSAFLRQLAGRFALVLIDSKARRTILAVDPMGIERLTYAQAGQGLVFGTSAEQVAHFPGAKAAIDSQAIFDYLMMHMIPAPNTIFAGVKKLRPATCAILENGVLRLERYWEPRFASRQTRTFAELKANLFESLRSGVRDSQLNASQPDAATGAFLSGGLDSSTVAGVLSEVGPKPTNTFSIGFGYADYDELSFARIANARFGCTGHEHTIHGNDIVESFARIAQAYDEPFGNSSALPAYYCARLAKEHGVSHLLAGDGGDELFGGNSRYVEQQVFEHYARVPKLIRSALLEPAVKHWPTTLDLWPIRKARGYIDKAKIPLPARLETWNIVQRLGAAEILHPDFLSHVDVQAPFVSMQEVWDSTPSGDLLNHMLYYDWHYTLADNDLRKVETMCALAEVKVSYPMLHPAVIDMSTSITPDIMMPGTKLRHFYKQAMTGFLPEEIIHKKKHGFGLPFGLWLQESAPLRDLIYGNLASLRKRGVIRESFIDRLLNLHGQEDARYYGVFLWVLAMLEQWFQEHKLAP